MEAEAPRLGSGALRFMALTAVLTGRLLTRMLLRKLGSLRRFLALLEQRRMRVVGVLLVLLLLLLGGQRVLGGGQRRVVVCLGRHLGGHGRVLPLYDSTGIPRSVGGVGMGSGLEGGVRGGWENDSATC